MKPLPPNLSPDDLESKAVLKALTRARAALAELKGVASSIPNEQILIDTLSLQEAKDSSAIENIVTTHDELYKSSQLEFKFSSAQAKEVHAYAEALKYAFKEVKANGFIRINLIKEVQAIIEANNAGIRKLPGTELKNDLTGEVVYRPPQDHNEVLRLLDNLELFINEPSQYEVDPLVKMSIIHHQFESIHPFYDGNGRTGRILNILFLIKEGFLGLPILYLSKFIIRYRADYYRLLQEVRETSNWEPWILYMLKAVEQTSLETIETVKSIKTLMMAYKKRIRAEEPKIYSQDLINSLFKHPYTKISFLMNDLRVVRQTATKYLEQLTEMGLLHKVKQGRSSYYINKPLYEILRGGNSVTGFNL